MRDLLTTTPTTATAARGRRGARCALPGGHRPSRDRLDNAWAALDLAGRYPELAAIDADLRLALPASDAVTAPIVLDLDIGGDPDDALTLACAARLPELWLVITSDEIDGERARLARHPLDLLGRTDVQVVAGADLGNRRYWVAHGLTPASVPAQTGDVVEAVRAVCARADGPVRWVGCGPMTNLARVLRAVPELAGRLVITQMGGALHYRDPAKAEHNVRLDPAAARFVAIAARHLTLVLSDVTFTDEIAIGPHPADPGYAVYRALAAADAPAWARLLAEHLVRWAAAFDGRTSKQHDPLTLAVALGLSFVYLARVPVVFASDGRLRADPAGLPTAVALSADYPAFRRWLPGQLGLSCTWHHH
ncbi:nucleoside hydrolase [Nocardia wallacei]|uniref:nucleoside hydrolase n=1 Tax=Nocardia wallacei TaxID=480035 RepID=UPI00245783B9|nr:nucleoside hydrolase [Nocardia wallacei]